jgi:hypothetical protein
MAMAAMIRMIAITISSSIKEKPFCLRIEEFSLLTATKEVKPGELPTRALSLGGFCTARAISQVTNTFEMIAIKNQ